jgi:hypothetical protein
MVYEYCGRNWGTELHYAAMHGKLELATKLLDEHPEMATEKDEVRRLRARVPRARGCCSPLTVSPTRAV